MGGFEFHPLGERFAREGVCVRERDLVLPGGLPQGTWREVLEVVAPIQVGATWWLGDLLRFAEDREWGETYALAAEVTRRSVNYLRNLAWVSRKVPAERRRAELPWRAHRAVAPLDGEEQVAWLARAVEEDWTSDELERHLRGDGKRQQGLVVEPAEESCPACGREWSLAA